MGIFSFDEEMKIDPRKQLTAVGVTLLVENTARGRGIQGEHGLSWWIETGEGAILFDLGQGMVLRHNAARLGVDLAKAQAVVVSHGHYDHVGGWPGAVGQLGSKVTYLHPDALKPKYSKRAGGGVATVSDPLFLAELDRVEPPLVQTREPVEVLPGIYTTGEVPRRTAYEDTGGPFMSDPEGREPDPLRDDQAVFFQTGRGTVVVLGCAHAGVINTLEHVRDLTGARLHAVIGGMHLVEARAERIRRTIEALRAMAPDWIGPNHCTGDAAAAELWHAFAPRCLECHAGQTLHFPIVSA